MKYATFSGLRVSLFSRNDLHSAVQPPVNALGNQAMTTAFFPLNSESLYVLPSEPGSEKSGALSPALSSSSALDLPSREHDSESRQGQQLPERCFHGNGSYSMENRRSQLPRHEAITDLGAGQASRPVSREASTSSVRWLYTKNTALRGFPDSRTGLRAE